ncbi:MAG: 4-hydroxythreonine-4-phosphate dehydrogenase PdxA [Planctomycetota bacterium]
MIPPSISMALPRVAITMGDAAGVGPELALKVCQAPRVRDACVPILVGHADLLARVGKLRQLPVPPTTDTWQVDHAAVFECGELDASRVTPGIFDAATGRASYEAVCTAIDAAMTGSIDALVTGPIQKEAWAASGIHFPGHTELLADRAGRSATGQPADVRMMLTSPEITCVLETIHIPLADVPKRLSVDSLVRTIELATFAVSGRIAAAVPPTRPKIAVLGLNPHAGEHGMFSHGEEESIVIPAIELARDRGHHVIGPLPPDTAFTPAMRDRVDAYVCLYHDQGLIPLKALAFDEAVNVTLGLPIIRTSVDHGTAMDLAWQGTASPSSLIAAIQTAASMATAATSGSIRKAP